VWFGFSVFARKVTFTPRLRFGNTFAALAFASAQPRGAQKNVPAKRVPWAFTPYRKTFVTLL